MNITSRPIVLLTEVPADLREALGASFELVTTEAPEAPTAEIALTTAMRGLSAADLDQFPNVKLVLSQGVGLDKLDLVAASVRGVQVSVTPNILTEDVADFAIGLTYAVGRRIAQSDRFVRDGRWGPERMALSTSLHNKRVGIVGMGRIGQAIARRAAGLGMEVGYTARTRKSDLSYDYFGNPVELASASDFLILVCPGGAATHHLCNQDVLDALGVGGFLINISRGSVVDEAALIKALTENRIAGAALDVFETEPKLNPAFLTMENVVLTPHSASLTKEVRATLISSMLAEAQAFLDGKPLRHVANEEQLNAGQTNTKDTK